MSLISGPHAESLIDVLKRKEDAGIGNVMGSEKAGPANVFLAELGGCTSVSMS